eukprot:scaffold5773_cov116-Isochrysis_galbana.AAC.2
MSDRPRAQDQLVRKAGAAAAATAGVEVGAKVETGVGTDRVCRDSNEAVVSQSVSAARVETTGMSARDRTTQDPTLTPSAPTPAAVAPATTIGADACRLTHRCNPPPAHLPPAPRPRPQSQRRRAPLATDGVPARRSESVNDSRGAGRPSCTVAPGLLSSAPVLSHRSTDQAASSAPRSEQHPRWRHSSERRAARAPGLGLAPAELRAFESDRPERRRCHATRAAPETPPRSGPRAHRKAARPLAAAASSQHWASRTSVASSPGCSEGGKWRCTTSSEEEVSGDAVNAMIRVTLWTRSHSWSAARHAGPATGCMVQRVGGRDGTPFTRLLSKIVTTHYIGGGGGGRGYPSYTPARWPLKRKEQLRTLLTL